MADNKLFQRLDDMQRQMDDLDFKLNSEQFSDRFKYYKQIIISNPTGRLQIEERTSLPSVALIGEITAYSGRLYQGVAVDAWQPLGTLPKRSIAAGTAADSPSTSDGLILCSTDASQALTITHPEAADNIGRMMAYTFVTDGGQNVTINRTGADTFDDNGDTGNTSLVFANVGETVIFMAVQDNIWAVLNLIGGTLS